MLYRTNSRSSFRILFPLAGILVFLVMGHTQSLIVPIYSITAATVSTTYKQHKRIPSKRRFQYATLSDTAATTTDTAHVNTDESSPQTPSSLLEVDARYNTRTQLEYNPSLDRFVYTDQDHHTPSNRQQESTRNNPKHRLIQMLSSAFLPEGVTSTSYYRYIQWRTIQRYINAIVHVIGTQSLLMGLGKISTRKFISTASTTSSSPPVVLGIHAALHWVLKDALGKIVRMIWASQMGMKFDSDAKRWRFRSAFIYAAGNGLEITTYMYPQFFLLFATLGNACKQMSLLTNSATRNALYNCFRDGTRENIGDITAKGEAQIAVVDLLGIASGVTLSRTFLHF